MDENANNTGKVVGIVVTVVVILAVLAGVWYFFMYKPAQEAKEKARLEQLAKEKAEKKRQEEEARKKAQYEKLIADADAEFEQENWENAKTLYTNASNLFPNETYPKDQLTLVNATLDQIAELEARRAAGIIETISSETGRFYVVVSSSVDDDLAMDYAKKLVKEGNIVKIIEPSYRNKLFYRVSLGDYDTWDQAVASIGTFSSYGNGVWVLKY